MAKNRTYFYQTIETFGEVTAMQILFLVFLLIFTLACILIPLRKVLLWANPQAGQARRAVLITVTGIYMVLAGILTACTGAMVHGYVLYIIFILCAVAGFDMFLLALRNRDALCTSGVILLISYLVILFAITLFGRIEMGHSTGINMYIFQTLFPENPYSQAMGLHFVQNIALFIPAGASICLACRPKDRTVFKAFYYGCLLTVLIESAQGIFHLGLCDIDDMISNIWGCMLGYGCMEAAGFFIANAERFGEGRP